MREGGLVFGFGWGLGMGYWLSVKVGWARRMGSAGG